MNYRSWLWPDHVIGKRESRKLREEHNQLVNHCVKLQEACNKMLALFQGPNGEFQEQYEDQLSVACEIADAAIAEATKDLHAR
jgi:hypothetical protein